MPVWPSLFSARPLISLICSTHLLILSLRSTAACHFIPGGCSTEHLTSQSSPPRRLVMWYLSSSLRPIFWNLHQAEGKKCTNKNKIIKLWNSFVSIWAIRFHASHLFRAGKLIQFAPFASHLIQRPLTAVKHASSGRWFYSDFFFFSSCTLTTDVSSYEISFINVTRQMKAAEKASNKWSPMMKGCRLHCQIDTALIYLILWVLKLIRRVIFQ